MENINLTDEQNKETLRVIDKYLKSINVPYWNMCIRSDKNITAVYVFHTQPEVIKKPVRKKYKTKIK